MKGLTRTSALVALAVVPVLTYAAENAQSPGEGAAVECTEPAPSDSEREFTKKLYDSHVGFESLFRALSAGCRMQGFLQRLRGGVSDPAKITSDDIADAAAPQTLSEKLASYIEAAKLRARRLLESDEESTQRLHRAMKEGIYIEGEFDADGFMRRGIEIDRYGTVRRGDFERGRLSGAGQEITPDGTVQAGTYVGGSLAGPGARQNPEGTVLEGTFENGKPIGEMIATLPDGRRERQLWAADGTMKYAGPVEPLIRGIPRSGWPVPLDRPGDNGKAMLEEGIRSAAEWEAGRPAREAREAAERAAAERTRVADAAALQRARQQAAEAEQQRLARERNNSSQILGALAAVAGAYVAAMTGGDVPVAAPPPSTSYGGGSSSAPAYGGGGYSASPGTAGAAVPSPGSANDGRSRRVHDPALSATGCISIVNAKAAGIASNFTWLFRNSCAYPVTVLYAPSGRFDSITDVPAMSQNTPLASGGASTRFTACRRGTLHRVTDGAQCYAE